MLIPDHLNIALLTSQDVDDLCEIYLRYMTEAGFAVSEVQVHQLLQTLLQVGWVVAVGARYEERLVGFGMGNLTYTNIRCGIALHLGDLFVDRLFRGRRVSKYLLKTIRDYAKEHGITRIFGNVAPRTTRYFLRHGWKNSDQHFLYWDI